MKKSLIFIWLLLLAMVSNSCEKDDLCTPDQAVTPRLVIEFKDASNPSENKSVDQIQLQEISSSDFAPLNDDGVTLLTNTESISIPLRIDAEETAYNFISTDDTMDNTNTVNFNYLLREEYVSRSCGFRNIYLALDATLQPVTGGNTPWIQDVIVINESVTNSTDIHVQILH